MNYKIIVHQNPNNLGTEVIAVSSYAGRPVRGKAICAPDDAFDEEKGIALAKARCDAKIAKKRAARARKCLQLARIKANEAEIYLDEMRDYFADAEVEAMATEEAVHKLLENM